jgi:hypothetical protein
MSGIDGCFFNDDRGFQYYPGKIFSRRLGPNGGKRKDEPEERKYWQEVSTELQRLGLGAYQARKKIYELEERFNKVSSKVVEILYHDSPQKIARKLYEKS